MKSQAISLIVLLINFVVLVAQHETQLVLAQANKGNPEAKVEKHSPQKTPEEKEPVIQALNREIQQINKEAAEIEARNKQIKERLEAATRQAAEAQRQAKSKAIKTQLTQTNALVNTVEDADMSNGGVFSLFFIVWAMLIGSGLGTILLVTCKLLGLMGIGGYFGYQENKRKKAHERRLEEGKKVEPVSGPEGLNPVSWFKCWWAAVRQEYLGFNETQPGSRLFRWAANTKLVKKVLKLKLDSQVESEFSITDSWAFQWGLPIMAVSFIVPMLLKVESWSTFFGRGIAETCIIFAAYALAFVCLWLPRKALGFGGKWSFADHYIACIRPCLPIYIPVLGMFFTTQAAYNTAMGDFSVTMVVETFTANLATIVVASIAGILATSKVSIKGHYRSIGSLVIKETWRQPLVKAMMSLVIIYPVASAYCANPWLLEGVLAVILLIGLVGLTLALAYEGELIETFVNYCAKMVAWLLGLRKKNKQHWLTTLVKASLLATVFVMCSISFALAITTPLGIDIGVSYYELFPDGAIAWLLYYVCMVNTEVTAMLLTIGAGRGLVMALMHQAEQKVAKSKTTSESGGWKQQLNHLRRDRWLAWVAFVSLVILPLSMLQLGGLVKDWTGLMTQRQIELLSLYFAVSCSLSAYILIKKCKNECDDYYPAMLYIMVVSFMTLTVLVAGKFFPTIYA